MSHLSETTVGTGNMILLNPTLEFEPLEDGVYEAKGNSLSACFDSLRWHIWIGTNIVSYGSFLSSTMTVEQKKGIVQKRVEMFVNSLFL